MFPILNISAKTLRNIKLIIHSLVYLLRFKSRFLIRAEQSTLKILKSWVLQIRQSELTNLGARQRDKILSGARLVWIPIIFIAYTKTIQIYTFVSVFLVVVNTMWVQNMIAKIYLSIRARRTSIPSKSGCKFTEWLDM